MNASKILLWGSLVSACLLSMRSSAIAGIKGEASDPGHEDWIALPADWDRDDLAVYDTCVAATQLFENMWEDDFCVGSVEDSQHLKTVVEREEYVLDEIEGLLPSEVATGACYSNLVGRFWECLDEPTTFEQNVCVNRAIRTYNDCILEDVGK